MTNCFSKAVPYYEILYNHCRVLPYAIHFQQSRCLASLFYILPFRCTSGHSIFFFVCFLEVAVLLVFVSTYCIIVFLYVQLLFHFCLREKLVYIFHSCFLFITLHRILSLILIWSIFLSIAHWNVSDHV